jgi:penicillin amidase/acyl-homoserine-lactone acylase
MYTALVVYTLEPVVRAMIFNRTPPDPVKTFVERAKYFHEQMGKFDVPWGDVNRLVRGDLSLPLSGGPDTLHAVYAEYHEENKRLEAMAGDCYILMVSWDKDGNVHSNSIHQFGSATLDESSPHYADQAPLFAKMEMKPVWMTEDEIRQHLEAEYKPGEERPAP